MVVVVLDALKPVTMMVLMLLLVQMAVILLLIQMARM